MTHDFAMNINVEFGKKDITNDRDINFKFFFAKRIFIWVNPVYNKSFCSAREVYVVSMLRLWEPYIGCIWRLYKIHMKRI